SGSGPGSDSATGSASASASEPASRTAPVSGRHWWLRTGSVALAAIVMIGLGAELLRTLDPFGLDRNSQAHSEFLYSRMAAPFYDSRAQGDIAVVIIDLDTLEKRGFAWPPRYEYYAEAVRRI